MREAGVPAAGGLQWEEPLHVMDAIRALDAFMNELAPQPSEAWGQGLYSSLSEFSHPNMGAFSQYYRFEATGPTDIRVHFAPLRQVNERPAVPEVVIAVSVTLDRAARLLMAASDAETCETVRAALDGLYRERGGPQTHAN
jgi:hypothetical protein